MRGMDLGGRWEGTDPGRESSQGLVGMQAGAVRPQTGAAGLGSATLGGDPQILPLG